MSRLAADGPAVAIGAVAEGAAVIELGTKTGGALAEALSERTGGGIFAGGFHSMLEPPGSCTAKRSVEPPALISMT